MTACTATTDGPRAWPCTREQHDDRGHIFVGDTPADRHGDENDQEAS